MTRWAIEWIWAFYAYACGRLYFKRYRILRTRYDEDMNLVRFSFPVSPSSLKKLMWLWKCREVVGEELEGLLDNVTPATAPFLGYDSLDSQPRKKVAQSYDLRTVWGIVLLMVSPLIVLLVEYVVDLIKK